MDSGGRVLLQGYVVPIASRVWLPQQSRFRFLTATTSIVIVDDALLSRAAVCRLCVRTTMCVGYFGLDLMVKLMATTM